jgi:CysZ protein
MLTAAFKALGDLLSGEFRAILLKAIGLTLVLFAALMFITQLVLWQLTLLPWPWAETILAVGTGIAMAVLFFFLMGPVTALFAGIYLDRVAEIVERKHYPGDAPGRPLNTAQSIITALQFGALALVVNIAVLPMVFFAIGAAVLVAANAYLISREYFEMAAARHLPLAEARAFRKANTPQVFVAGLLPALAAIVPVLNLVVPLFATSYFVHLFKRAQASSA